MALVKNPHYAKVPATQKQSNTTIDRINKKLKNEARRKKKTFFTTVKRNH